MTEFGQTTHQSPKAERASVPIQSLVCILDNRPPPNGSRLSCGADTQQALRQVRLLRSWLAHKRNSSQDRAPSASSAC